MAHSDKQSIYQHLSTQATIIGSFVALFWILEILDVFFLHGYLDRFGIFPQQLVGLRGVLFAPFLHGGFPHLISNTLPFVILGWLVMVQETSDFWIVTFLSMVVGGLGVWVIAPMGTVHIGSSILIFGYFGFLLFRGWFQKNPASVFLSIFVFALYGTLIWGVLPTQVGVSWQGHLFGFLGGVLAAKLISKEKRVYK
ncbi:MAG: rhomboid family intramembrane serine protease [Microcystaceae cyanobacterium]